VGSRAWLRIAGAAAVLAVLACVSVPDEPKLHLCPFYWLTGRPCPLCGVTRGLFALAKGRWSAAIHFNALTPLAFAMLLSMFWNAPWRSRLWTVGLAAFMVYGICRAALA
jgi:hypothetical protein